MWLHRKTRNTERGIKNKFWLNPLTHWIHKNKRTRFNYKLNTNNFCSHCLNFHPIRTKRKNKIKKCTVVYEPVHPYTSSKAGSRVGHIGGPYPPASKSLSRIRSLAISSFVLLSVTEQAPRKISPRSMHYLSSTVNPVEEFDARTNFSPAVSDISTFVF